MTTERVLHLIEVLQMQPAPKDDPEMYWHHRGWNESLEALAKQVRLEEALNVGREYAWATEVPEALYRPLELASTDRAAGLADFADSITRHPSIEADWGRS